MRCVRADGAIVGDDRDRARLVRHLSDHCELSDSCYTVPRDARAAVAMRQSWQPRPPNPEMVAEPKRNTESCPVGRALRVPAQPTFSPGVEFPPHQNDVDDHSNPALSRG